MTIFYVILIAVVVVLAPALIYALLRLHRQDLQMQELERQRNSAVHKSEAKDLFVQNMSHEVRTPLNAVVGFAQLLALPPELITDKERAEYCEHIQQNSTLLTMLIDDILAISDLQGGNYKVNPTECLVKDICASALGTVKYRVTANVELRYQSTVPEEYCIIADPRRVQQILINYLTNAIKHTAAGTITLTTSLTEHPGMITFAVEDTGEGVPIAQAKNIFRRFTKLNDYVHGTGLGLNICLTLAEKMNGHVFLDTSYMGGARFVFCLPITEE